MRTRNIVIIGVIAAGIIGLAIITVVNKEGYSGPFTFTEGKNSEELFSGPNNSPEKSLSTLNQHYYSLGGGDTHFPYTIPQYLPYENPYSEPIINGKPLSETLGYFRGNTSIFPLVPKTAIHEYPWQEIGVICNVKNPMEIYTIQRRKKMNLSACNYPCALKSASRRETPRERGTSQLPSCNFDGIQLGKMCGNEDDTEYRVIMDDSVNIEKVNHNELIKIKDVEYRVRLYPEFRN